MKVITKTSPDFLSLMISLGFGLIFLQAQATAQTWPQWGGPQRNFMTDAKGLAESWPAAGPKRLWSRELGEGHSSVVAEAGRLYTMYSRGEQEFVVALEAATGKTLWEKSHAAPSAGLRLENGKGPHATPLLVGELLFTVGVLGKLQAFDKQTGNIIWSHDLWQEYGGYEQAPRWSRHPPAYKSLVAVAGGGASHPALIASERPAGQGSSRQQSFE